MKNNSFFNKQQHQDAVDDEKGTEAQHRALAKMLMGLPSDKASPAVMPPTAPAAPASPFAPITSALTSAKKPNAFRGKGYSDGGEVEDKGPAIDSEKAKAIQAGATQSGWQPAQWSKNLKEGLGLAHGGVVPARVSPGEGYLPPKDAQEVAAGEKSAADVPKFPGKAKVPGDSAKNDTEKAALQEGSIVIPRSTMEKADPNETREFIRAHLKKMGKI